MIALRIPAPSAVRILPPIEAFAAVGASGVKFQKPEVTANGELLEALPATPCPIVPSSAKFPPADCCPPPARTDSVTAKFPPVCAKMFAENKVSNALKIRISLLTSFLLLFYGQTIAVKTIAPALSIENKRHVAPLGDFKTIP